MMLPRSLTFAITICLSIRHIASAEECQEKGGRFERLFIITYDGSEPSITANRASTLEALGECRTIEAHTDAMIQHFQTTYGINASHIKDDPFAVYDEAEYVIVSHVTNPGERHRVLAGAYRDFSVYMDTRFHWMSWSITAKKEFIGSRGILPGQHWDLYGIMRFKYNGTYVCLEYKNREPTPNFFQRLGPSVIDLLLWNDEWKEGTSRGLAVAEKNRISLRYSITFPASFE